MPLQQRFKTTSKLDADELRKFVTETLSGKTCESISVDTELTPEELRQFSPEDIEVHQKAGIAAETILVTFATKVAYDVWKELVLPKLKARFGGAAVVQVDGARET